ncbi:hypothetical protein ES288_A09G291900v1 [Gossypium darwinii]|uniref:Uncharacterized protein n=1 Tax=Gossypium darwinii TaxID=34276 RepID=A0A5D2FG05_GOSDA|nr:hypothetical protein ES288_A09G291900v1 [Gossypium darwinii]
MAESDIYIAALNCSGAIFGSLPISPSKTPVRPRTLHPAMQLNILACVRSIGNIFTTYIGTAAQSIQC